MNDCGDPPAALLDIHFQVRSTGATGQHTVSLRAKQLQNITGISIEEWLGGGWWEFPFLFPVAWIEFNSSQAQNHKPSLLGLLLGSRVCVAYNALCKHSILHPCIKKSVLSLLLYK